MTFRQSYAPPVPPVGLGTGPTAQLCSPEWSDGADLGQSFLGKNRLFEPCLTVLRIRHPLALLHVDPVQKEYADKEQHD